MRVQACVGVCAEQRVYIIRHRIATHRMIYNNHIISHQSVGEMAGVGGRASSGCVAVDAGRNSLRGTVVCGGEGLG